MDKNKKVREWEEEILRDSKNTEELARRICGYGSYDSKGVERKDIEKYLDMGARFERYKVLEALRKVEVAREKILNKEEE